MCAHDHTAGQAHSKINVSGPAQDPAQSIDQINQSATTATEYGIPVATREKPVNFDVHGLVG